MVVKKKFEVALSGEDILYIKHFQKLIENICDEITYECVEECPFYKICGESPSAMIMKAFKCEVSEKQENKKNG